MYNKRLLLLGVTILVLGSGWKYPAPAIDTERLAVTPAVQVSYGKADPQTYLFSTLFLATSVGASNGARLNPKALNFIQDYVKENWEELQLVRMTGGPSFNLIEGILSQYDLPRELKYLAVIESNLKSSAVSRVGAAGPWQLMPQTARDLGLKVNKNVDERRNYVKSTRAAALYLKDLYNQLGDWLLVIAAYNTGTAHVNHAIRLSGSRNFWDLQYFLPAESRIHVKKFIGTQYVFEGQGSVTTLTRDEAMEQLSGSAMYVFHRQLNEAELNGSRTVAVSGKYISSVIARFTLMDSADFSRYNPDFDKIMSGNNNSYDLKLPADKMDLFEANKYQILMESMEQLESSAIDIARVTVR
ncbi:MAG TPA: lytic transglycosylase domain-containing protein [Puia sp.]|jgi:membrane-bound lytic murein transglycosylase D|nr:lytic transglycosylase domain-containing protein [Puia sp.]